MPNNPILESDDKQECINECISFGKRYDVNCYVVDRERIYMEEIYIFPSSSFSKTYNDTREQIKKLKEGK